MVRISLLIFTLLSMFLLNACGNNNIKNPANMDDQDAVAFRTGKVSGKAHRAVEREYNENDELVEKQEEVLFEDVDVEADFDTKTVIVKAKVKNAQDKFEDVVYRGTFGDNGVAILRPEGGDLKTAATVRCTGGTCDNLTTDLGIIRNVGGKEEFVAQQFPITNPIITRPKEENKEIIPASSNVTGAPAPAPAAPIEKPKTTAAKLSAPPVVATVPRIAAPKKVLAPAPVPTPVAEVEDVSEVAIDPGVSKNKSPILVSEDIIRGANTLEEGPANYPYNLGDKYPGKAIGRYDSGGALVKGSDVISNVDDKSFFGFLSVDRSDNIYYGSGLLVKIIEDASKSYNELFPGNKFEVNDLSKKSGGRITKRRDGVKHGSHQNGLDVDILLPKKSRSFDYEKTWAIIKSLTSTGFVDVIFLNSVRINELCSYLKSKNEQNYQAAFGTLYKWSGHTTHLHARMKCTKHNPSCVEMTYSRSKYATCK